MKNSIFDPSFEELPKTIPVFPLTGVLLLPAGKLPLNIFEPRYLAMVRDALSDRQRIIGMLQPLTPDADDNRGPTGSDRSEPQLYKTGCAGRITSFTEAEDGRYLLTLSGVCRFEIAEEIKSKDGYRRVLADFRKYNNDLGPETKLTIERERLLIAVKQYFDAQDIKANWEAIEGAPNDQLITSLAMTCPFGPNERQAILEAQNLTAQAEIVMTLLEMAIRENGGSSVISH